MQKHITASHDQGINKTAVETSDQSQNNAAGCSDNCSDQSAGKGQSGTYHQTAEYILAKLICTPDMSRAWSLKKGCVIRLIRCVRNNKRCNNCH